MLLDVQRAERGRYASRRMPNGPCASRPWRRWPAPARFVHAYEAALGWEKRGRPDEAARAFAQVVAAEEAGDALRLRARFHLGRLCYERGDVDPAREHLAGGAAGDPGPSPRPRIPRGDGPRDRRHRMKVLVVHPLGLRFAGYPYIEEKVQALAQHGIEVAVVAPFKDETTMVDGRTPSFARIPLAFDRRGWMTREARRAITRFEPDVIHVWTPRALPSRIALEARVATGADVIVNYEDPEHLHFEQAEGPFRSRDVLAPLEKANPTPDDIGRFLRDMPWDWVLGTLRAPFATPFLHPLFFGLLNQSAAGFTGIWKPWVDLLATRFERPSLLMPLAVDLARLRPPSPEAIAQSRASLGVGPDTLLLLRAGVLYSFVDDQTPMLEGYAAFLRTHPEARLVMCGHNYQEGRIATALKRFGIAHKVRWLGFLDAPDYAALLHAADVTLCPGYPDEYNRFRLAGKIVEYMIAGRPMICYASGIGEDLVDGRDALLLDPYTPENVERQLTRAADPELRRALGARAYSWPASGSTSCLSRRSWRAFYRTCVADAAARAGRG